MIYYSVENNRIVKASMDWEYNTKIFLYRKLGLEINISELADKYIYSKTNRFGIAKCHPDDTFNLNTGKKLARKRLLDKYIKVRNKIYNEVLNKITNIEYIKYNIHRKEYIEDFLYKIDRDVDSVIALGRISNVKDW